MDTTRIVMCAASVIALTGCGAAVRSPDMYRDDTKAVLVTKNAEILACYDGVLKSTPDAHGRVTLRFDVETEQGKITNVSVDPAGTTAPAPVTECVTRNIGGLDLSPPDGNKGEGTWTYEFVAPPPPKPSPSGGKS